MKLKYTLTVSRVIVQLSAKYFCSVAGLCGIHFFTDSDSVSNYNSDSVSNYNSDSNRW